VIKRFFQAACFFDFGSPVTEIIHQPHDQPQGQAAIQNQIENKNWNRDRSDVHLLSLVDPLVDPNYASETNLKRLESCPLLIAIISGRVSQMDPFETVLEMFLAALFSSDSGLVYVEFVDGGIFNPLLLT